MTAFVPIRDRAQLPTVGSADAVEGHTLDFKEWHNGIVPADLEVAKDVAAFANASGGVVIYGATEQRDAAGELNGRLDKYEGKTPADADAWCKRVDAIVRDRCHPPPIIEPRAMLAPDGASSLVVVNINPAVGQAIGVRVLAKTVEWVDPATAKRTKGTDAYVFPMRAGEGTRWLNPEQVSMLMIPRLRRTISLLRQIPASEKIHMEIFGTDNVWRRGEFQIEGIEELENALLVRPTDPPRDLQRWPLDAVCTTWRGTVGTAFKWRVYIDLTATGR